MSTDVFCSLKPFFEILDEYALEQTKALIPTPTYRQHSSGAGSHTSTLTPPQRGHSRHVRRSFWIHLFLRIAVLAIIVALSIAIPQFDKIMEIMGAVLCCLISILMPSAFHLKLLGNELSAGQKVLDYALLGLGGAMGVIGTFGVVLL